MNQPQKFNDCASSRVHLPFDLMFMGGLGVSLWLVWGPHSGIRWDGVSKFGLVAASTQLVLYGLRFFSKLRGWRPTVASDGVFFAINLGISLLQINFGLGYYWWVFLVFLGLMLVVLPKRLSLIIAAIATILFVPCTVGWSHLHSLTFSDSYNQFYPLAFPWILGLLYRHLLDRNSERADLITKLQAAKAALETTRDRDIELATLRERERLARDFHDTLGHQLVTLTVQLEAAERLLTVDPTRAAAMLVEMQKLSRTSMDELRRSLDNLRASGLGQRPLAEALQTLCTDVGQRFSIAVDCQLPASMAAFPPAVAEVLWRVAQEGLTNAGQHSRARHVSVNLNMLPKEIVLRVTDDGVGLPAGAEEKPGHYGLRGLRERVEGLGGTFTLATAEGGGTVMEARLPIIA